MSPGKTLTADRALLLLLVAVSLWVASPVLFGGGAATYLDNSTHQVEILDLAAGQRGWSESAFCGFPVGILHSPLWYGALAALVRAGAPVEPLYAAGLWLGYVAPPLALWSVARRRAGPLASALLALLLLLQPSAIHGLFSALGGMWTFHMAGAFFLLLVGELARQGPLRVARVAALVGLCFVTHLFTLAPALLAVLGRALLALRDEPRPAVTAGRLAGAVALGALAASCYWAPLLLLSGDATDIQTQHLPLVDLLGLLLTPADVMSALNHEANYQASLLSFESIPPVAIFVLGVLGGAQLPDPEEDPLPALGLGLAAALLALLTVAPALNLTLLGPVSWRLLFFVRLGLCLGAITIAARLRPARLSPGAGLLVALLALAMSTLGRLPLARRIFEIRAGLAEATALWGWLAAHRDASWGRVYLQDTFMSGGPLTHSHLLARSAHESGIDQLGPYYGVVPFRTRWTLSEFGRLFLRRIQSPEDRDFLLFAMERSNCTHLVLPSGPLSRAVASDDAFRQLYSSRAFQVFERIDARSLWAEPAEGQTTLVEAREAGKISLVASLPEGTDTVRLREAYHPFWQLDAPAGARLREEPKTGMLTVTGLAAGQQKISLEFRLPVAPLALSWVAALAILALGLRERRAPAQPPEQEDADPGQDDTDPPA